MLLLLSLASLTSPAVCGEARNIARNSLTKFNMEMADVYKDQGSYQLITSVRDGFLRIEFCPDNTCDEFKLPIASPLDRAYDFIYLFEFSTPSYEELEKKWKNKTDVSRHVSRLTARYRSLAKCNSKYGEQAQRICVMRYLIASQHIEISTVRYDEGKRVASPASLDEFLPK